MEGITLKQNRHHDVVVYSNGKNRIVLTQKRTEFEKDVIVIEMDSLVKFKSLIEELLK